MNLDRYGGPTLSLFRIVAGLMFLEHGVAKLFGLFGGAGGTGETVEFGAWPGFWSALVELGCGSLIALGLFTRVAAFLASGAMAYAYFTVHQPQGPVPLVNHGELAAMYSWSFLLICILGPGTWALDTFIRRRYGANTGQSADQRENVGRRV
ncbi:hypothetical protein C1I98_23335 [Spongiactinospora gelatinilytica]|uniref:DoxX family protein n=1 Tax=Spongiactinospora gelatinilytica TaxID=2666298 RepID=A0A2W2GAY8_9ACTN|nr:DoxX family protein [Spongiactinospora gelatinilytica]PZG39719.1 hypothetical protein C1I98_23335 [Spongiactinospora gelatinilytica]